LQREVKHLGAPMITTRQDQRTERPSAAYGGHAYYTILMDRLRKDPELPSVGS
jgi:hypothetical protein